MVVLNYLKKTIRFDRNELSGSFGDIGTDLPLIVGMILASGIDSASTFIVYGVMQMFSGLVYGIPMAVQPLKAVATIVIAQKITGDVIYGAGLAIGCIMFFLTVSGLIKKLSILIPKAVVRGVQMGLGITLATIATKQYIATDSGLQEYILVFVAFAIALLLLGNRKYPPAIFIILLGAIYAFVFNIDNPSQLFSQVKLEAPNLHLPSLDSIWTGLLILALPQIPLSIGNSILASDQLVKDLYPEKKCSINKISFTYSFMNIVSPFFSGIPVCHGSGGLAGHHSFGARTGGSVVIYGIFFLVLGTFFSHNFDQIVLLFPMQILGVILLFESIVLINLVRDVVNKKSEFYIAILVALLACGLPYGFLIGMVVGTVLFYNTKKIKLLREE